MLDIFQALKLTARGLPYITKHAFGRWYVFRNAPLDLVADFAKLHAHVQAGLTHPDAFTASFFAEAAAELDRRYQVALRSLQAAIEASVSGDGK